MGLETVTDIDDLVITNPAASDPKSQGDDHLRNIKTALKNGFIGFTGTVIVTGTTGGSANTYTLTPSTALPDYVVGTLVCAKITDANTGASTMNISGLGAGAIQSVAGAAMTSGDLPAGRYAWMVITATTPVFQLLYVTKNYIDQLSFGTALPSQTGNSGKFVTTDGTSASWSELLKAGTIRFADSSDTTKRIAFGLTGITAGQTRTITVPDEDITLAGRGANTFTGKQTLSGAAIDEAKGADIASAATINLTTATGNLVDVTGTTTITAITLAEGAQRTVRFTGALTLTNGASLVLPGAANIPTAAGDFAVFRGYASGVVRCVFYSKADGSPVINPNGYTLHVRDEKSSGTAGGGSSSGYNNRDLNTSVTNTISGASLASNTITLPAGTYDIFASAPAHNGAHRLDLYNSTDTTTVLRGLTAQTTTVGVTTHSFLIGRFTLAAQKDLILRHYTSSTQAGNGLGHALSEASVNEVYTSVQIWKV